MRFAEFPFLRYSFFFISGILLYSRINHWPFSYFYSALLVIYFLYAFIIFINSYKKRFGFLVLIPFLAYLQLLLAGISSCYLKDIHHDQNNLINAPYQVHSYLAVVLDYDQSKPNSLANRVSLKKVFDGTIWQEAKGEVLLYHKSLLNFSPGDLVWIWGSPQKINRPSNPHEFDFGNFMLTQQISHQHFVSDQITVVGKLKEFPIESYFMHIRSGIMEGIDRKFTDTKSNQIAKALLLGQKKILDKDISEAYSTAGAMHVLAVSGLHVGIIYGFFFLFFKPYRLSKPYRILYLALIILLIWAYAMLTGMSASVMRAATMFTLMAMAQMNSRNPSIFNAIALSSILLLVFDPFLLYAVGFQLSYTALLGIVLIQPLLVSLWLPKTRIIEYAWQITTVGIAAQLATFPISGYYFHSFPVYFLLSNMIAIPGAFLIMSCGVPFMVFNSVPLLGTILAWISEKAISMVNYLIFWVQELPFSKISDLYLSSSFIIFYFLVLGILLVLVHAPGKKPLYTLIVVLTLVGFLRGYAIIEDIFRKEILIYGLEKGIAIDVLFKGHLYAFEDLNDKDLQYKVNPNRKKISSNSTLPLLAFYSGENLLIYLPGSLGNIVIQSDQIDFVNKSLKEQYYFWTEGEWRFNAMGKPIDLGKEAQKIVLN